MSIEVSVWDGASPTTKLAILDGAANVRWTDLLSDVGAGSCELSALDPKAIYCSEGNLIKLSLSPGTYIFAYYIEAPVLTSGEGAENKWTLAGPSVLSYLRYGAVYPASWAGNGVYPSTRSWTGATLGGILATLLTEAYARGDIPALQWGFTSAVDSTGTAWTANVNVTLDVGASLLDVVKKFVALGMGLAMDTQPGLYVYVPGTQGTNLTSTVIWRQGYHFRAPVTNTGSRSSMSTVALVKGVGGQFVEVTDPNYTVNPYIGRRESMLDYSQVSGDPTQMTNAGSQQIALSENASQSLAVQLTHGTGGLYEPYTDYRLGDTIAIDIPGSYVLAPFRIVGLTVAQTPGANYTVDANLGSIVLPLDLQLKQLLSSVSGSSSSLGDGIAGNLTLANPKGFPAGSAFPLNPTDGMWWFRPDLGEAYQYVAAVTKWLGAAEYSLALTPALLAANFGNGTYPSFFGLPQLTAIWLTFYDCMFQTGATNSGVNYWYTTCYVRKGDLSGATAIIQGSTAAMAVNSAKTISVPIGAPLDVTTYLEGYVALNSSGSPSALSEWAGQWRYRKIG